MNGKVYLFAMCVFGGLRFNMCTASSVNLSWPCVSNVSCVQSSVKTVLHSLKHHRSIDFGFMEIAPISASGEGRAKTSNNWWDVFRTNSVRVPLGPVVIGVEKSRKYDGYWEVALLRKEKSIGSRGLRERKHMQMFVPGFLVASQIGWYLLAIVTVKILAIKAILVAKLAFIVAAALTIKKLLFEHEPFYQGYMHPQYFEHPEPLLMPYSMDFAHLHHPGYHGADMNEIYPISISALGHDQTSGPHHAGSIAAESSVNQVIEPKNIAVGQPITPAASVAAAASAPVPAVAAIKRFDDFYPIEKPSAYYYKYPAKSSPYPLLMRKT